MQVGVEAGWGRRSERRWGDWCGERWRAGREQRWYGVHEHAKSAAVWEVCLCEASGVVRSSLAP